MFGWRSRAGLGLAIAASLLISVRLSGQQATLVADAHVNSVLPTMNSGGLSNLNVGNGYTTLLAFDLGVLPEGTTATQVSRATLTLYANRVDTPGLVSLAVVTGSWTEGGVTYATLPATGAVIQTRGVSQAGAYVVFDVTALVQGWVAAPAANFGVALTAAGASVQFDSKENDLTGHQGVLSIVLAAGSGTGAIGATGPAGPPGETGAAGPVGPQGLPGAIGPVGPIGPAGPAGTGDVGPIGPAGPAGAPGAAGAPGPAGATGVAGAPGPAGAVGVTGAPGAPGPAGVTGATGPVGPVGPAGPAGSGGGGTVGATGPEGPVGPAGAQGPSGPAGIAGATGLTFRGAFSLSNQYAMGDGVLLNGSGYVSLIAGNQGNAPDQSPGVWALFASGGAVGASGAVGPAGAAGMDGAAGPAGPPLTFRGGWLSGSAYDVGDAVSYAGGSYVAISANAGHQPDVSPGSWGLLAQAGAAGAAGAPGAAGMEGPSGLPGPAGAAGPPGVQGVTGPAGLVYRGGWSQNASYAAADAVSFSGSTYLSSQSGNLGNVPDASPSQWTLLAAAGATGAPGAAGADGPAGAPGVQGIAGATGPAGAPGILFRGAWGSGPNYAVGDAVTYQGATYLATAANVTVPPDANASVWTVLAAAGAIGPSGISGAAATVAVGSVVTTAAGTAATVTNSGSAQAAVLNFSIPQGAPGSSTSLPGSGGGGTLSSMVHAVSFVNNFYSISNPNQSATEDATILTWFPDGCTASQLRVFSVQSATITVTLRAGTPGAMADTGLSCQVSSGSNCVVSGAVVVAAGGFVDLSIAHPDSTPSAVWTALTCD